MILWPSRNDERHKSTKKSMVRTLFFWRNCRRRWSIKAERPIPRLHPYQWVRLLKNPTPPYVWYSNQILYSFSKGVCLDGIPERKNSRWDGILTSCKTQSIHLELLRRRTSNSTGKWVLIVLRAASSMVVASCKVTKDHKLQRTSKLHHKF